MAIARKQTVGNNGVGIEGTIPDFPFAPSSLLEVPGFTDHQQQVQRWWNTTRRRLGEFSVDGDSRLRKFSKEFTSEIASVTAAITEEAVLRANADGAEASLRAAADVSLTSAIGVVSASVTTEQSARIAADGAIHARWGVAIDVNGRIVGRVNLDGTNQSSTFKVSVDKFVVENVNGTIVAMDIRTGGKIVFGADIQSDNYSPASAGWRLTRNGDFEGNTGTFRGILTIFDGADNEVLVDSSGFSLGDRGSSRYIWMQNWSAGSSSSIGMAIKQSAYSMFYGSNNPYVYGVYFEHSGGTSMYYGLNPNPLLQMSGPYNFTVDAGSGIITTNHRLDITGDINVAISGALPGYGNADTGFQVEAGTGSIFASRASNFAASFNRNDNGALILMHRGGSQVGSISVNTTNTAYNTSSDRRLKTLIEDAELDGDRFDRIRIRRFEFIGQPGKKVLGVIAQELHKDLPEAVTPGDCGPEIKQQWGVDYSKFIPDVVLALQDLRRRVGILENARN